MLRNILKNGWVLIIASGLAAFAARCANAGLNIGDRAPEFELEDLNGNTVSLFDILKQDKPVILSFFGSWCDICLKEITELPEVTKQSDALVYLVGLDGDKENLARFANKHSVQFPILWDTKARVMGRKYDLMRGAILLVPKTVVVLPTGEIGYIAESYDEHKKEALAEKLTQLKGEKWDKPSELAVFFTGSINGRLQPAYSAKKTGGGFIKLLPFLNQQAKKYPNHLLLDTGDFLPYGVSATQAGFVFKAMSLAGYDAIAVGDQDLHFDGFLAVAAKKELPFVASNIALKNDNDKLAGLPEKNVKIGDVKVRILSFISPDTFSFYPEEFSGQFEEKDLKEALKSGKNADLLILLSHAGLEENKKIVAEFKDIDLIIGGHSQEVTAKSEKVGNTLIVQSGGNLETVGKIVLRFDSLHRLFGSSAGNTYEALPLLDAIPDDPRIAALIQESKAPQKREGR